MALSTTKTATLFIVALAVIVIFIVQQSDVLNMYPKVSIPSTEGCFQFSKILFILLASPKKLKIYI